MPERAVRGGQSHTRRRSGDRFVPATSTVNSHKGGHSNADAVLTFVGPPGAVGRWVSVTRGTMSR